MVLFPLKIPNIALLDVAFLRFQEAILGIGGPQKYSEDCFGHTGLFRKLLSIAFYLVKQCLKWTFFDFLAHCGGA